MNTSLAAHIAHNVTLAAAGWAGVSTVKSDHIKGIRAMAQATHNTCAACGEALTGTVEVCHIVGAPYGKGFAACNVYVGHKSCNDYDREVCNGDPYAIAASMVRPDLVLSVIPTRGEATAYGDATDRARRAARRDAARRGE